MIDYIIRIATWISQGLNTVFLLGNPDQTVSARCYVEYRINNNAGWRTPYRVLNFFFLLFFEQQDHCQESFMADLSYAEQVMLWKTPK